MPDDACYVEEEDQPDYCEDQWVFVFEQCYNDVEGQQDPYWWDENCDEMYAWLKE